VDLHSVKNFVGLSGADRSFRRLREEAHEWRAEKDRYIDSRIREGRHPDTDPAFWSGWQEPEMPALPIAHRIDLWHVLLLALLEAAAVAGMLRRDQVKAAVRERLLDQQLRSQVIV
jgi:hypothetical protein